MSLISKNAFGTLAVGALLFGALIAPGCSSDEQAAPPGGAGSTSHAGSGNAGKANNAGSAGKSENTAGVGNTGNEGGDQGVGGDDNTSEGGEGGAAGAPPVVECDQSFDNTKLTAITDNGGELPELP